MIRGALSESRLATVSTNLADIVRRVGATHDLTVLCGHRGQDEQTRAYAEGVSKKKWPDSRHNSVPARAVDLAPWPVDWKDIPRFETLVAGMKDAAALVGVSILCGADYKTFKDYPHFELKD